MRGREYPRPSRTLNPRRRITTKDTMDTKGRNYSQLGFRSVDSPLDAFPHMRHVEIQQQAEFEPTDFQIRQQLGAVNREQFLHCFEFDDDAVFDKKVDSIAGSDLDCL